MKFKTILFIALGFLASCTSKGTKEVSSTDWNEMTAFEVTIEKAFRPLKDSSTVDSVTRMMSQIADEAEKLASSKLPDKLANEEMKTNLEKLRKDTRDLAKEIATGTEDDVIGTDFYKIHDLYQEIHDAWKK